MVQLYNRHMTRRDVSAHSGALSAFAGVRLLELADGVERGVRMLEFRTGSGLRFTVMVDRGFDIGECDYKGAGIAWHSPTGFRSPALHEFDGESGMGFLRSFSGLISTCGIDHALIGTEDDADTYHYPHRSRVKYPIHGRAGMTPAKLLSYGESWEGDRCILFAEGLVQQSTVFGEDLHFYRRVETEVGGNEIRLKDRVVNRGFYRTPHMLLYHIDLGHPVLAEGSRVLAPIAEVVFAAHAARYREQGVGYRRAPAPIVNFAEQVWEHRMAADAAHKVPAALVNEALGLGFLIEWDARELPCALEWQNFHAGAYTIGIEPCTHHILGRKFARERDEMIWLEHGDERTYGLRLSVLDGAAAIAAAEEHIRAICIQPDEDYPEPTGNFAPILR